MIAFILACTLPALVTSYIVTALMRRYAVQLGLVDLPADRKVHEMPTPLGGGVGIYCGVVLPFLLAMGIALYWGASSNVPDWIPTAIASQIDGVRTRSGMLLAILVAGTLIMIMGLLDDRFSLSWKWRMGMQFLISYALVAGGVRGTIFISQPWIGAVITVLWMVVLINSLNFLDNMDGLTGGIGLIVSLMFASVMLHSTGEPRWLVGGCLLVLAGSLTGFLFHNWPPAKIFMGDAGSTFVGLMLATFTVLGTFYNEDLGTSRHVMLAPLCVLAVPLYDITSVILIRLREGRSPFHGDKAHFSHRLTDLGLSRRNAVLVVHFTTLTTGLGALLLYEVDDWAGALIVVSLVLCTLVIISILEMTARYRSERDQ